MPATAISSRPTIKGAVLVHFDFVLTGIVMTLLGPLLPVLSAEWRLSDAQAGYLFLAQFFASVAGMLASGPLVKRFGYRFTLMIGLVLMAAGIIVLALANWGLGLLSVCIFGFAFGTNTPAANLFMSDANPNNRASALNLLNSSWGIGAMACPLLIAAAQKTHHIPIFLYAEAAALLALALIGLGRVRFAADEKEKVLRLHASSTSEPWKNPFIFVVAALFFVYVGTETCVGGWVATYAQRMAGRQSAWAMTPAFFWGALLAGRALAPLPLRRLREGVVASIGLSVALLGIAVLMAAKTIPGIMLGAAVAGLGLASIYPISVSMLSHWFGDLVDTIGGPIFATGTAGGAVLPWLVGALSTHFHSLRAGFAVPLLGAAAMLSLYVATSIKSPQTAAVRPMPD